jgi:hypothetical protein
MKHSEVMFGIFQAISRVVEPVLITTGNIEGDSK